MTFEQWWQKCNPNANVEVHRDTEYYKVASAAWNDSQQIAIMRAVLRVSRMRKELLEDLERLEPGTAARAATASACNKLGGLIVELSEMT